MSVATPADPAAEAAARVFKSLPALRARPAERMELPDPEQLRTGIAGGSYAGSSNFSEHSCRRLRYISGRELCKCLRGALGAFGVERGYFVSLGARGSPWWR